MNEYIIITDSASDLSQELVEELGVQVLPLTVTVDGKTYRNYPDNHEIDPHEFYELLRGGSQAVTAAANMQAFDDIMRPVLESGKDVLYLAFSSALSSTCASAFTAAEDLKEQFPDRKIFVVDTLCASMGEGLFVYHVAMKQKAGATIEEAKEYAEQIRPGLAHWFTVDDLHHLKRGGRVSAATAVVGTALSIKPVLHVDEQGRLINVGKERGRKRSINALVEHMKQTAVKPEEQTVFISHGDCPEDADYLAELVKTQLGVKKIIINQIGPVIGAHSGPGTLALFFRATGRK
jgi:DegV family protein with EDD domain